MISLCETKSTPAGADGVIIILPPVRTFERSCELNLTNVAPNSLVQFNTDLEGEELQSLCDMIMRINCPGEVDGHCEDGVVTCYLPRFPNSMQTITLDIRLPRNNSAELVISYKGQYKWLLPW